MMLVESEIFPGTIPCCLKRSDSSLASQVPRGPVRWLRLLLRLLVLRLMLFQLSLQLHFQLNFLRKLLL